MTTREKGLWTAVIILTVSVAALGGLIMLRGLLKPGDVSKDDGDHTVAEMGQEGISEEQWVAELKKRYGTNTLLQMLNRRAVQAETKRLGIKITQEDLQQVLEQDSKGYDSEHAYFEEMQRQFGLDPVDLRNEAEYRIGLEKIATQGIQVEETEIDEYWEQHPEEFAVGKQIKLAALYVAKAEEAEVLLDRVKQGESFDTLLREHSGSGNLLGEDHSGQLGWVDEYDPYQPEAIMKAARELSSGDVAGPISINDGYAVIYVQDVRLKSSSDKRQIRQQIRRSLALAQAAPLDEVEKSLRDKYGARILSGKEEPSASL
ncbi:foldase protein PrsA [Paenibacillus jamilae]|jgi:foldase protein PrsA|uniref:peptidyl-prolyl cis-trans isomerase n=1 Tax=Paenibacillus TaxID=44249 RepID=UPI000D30F56C|nr:MULTISPECIES: peptidyl-prolyl cis-trans isomerase [Paenibacillus]MDP9679106.1 foldase protein PrsA [Paenibacillus jamilae]KAF6614784.1 peptidyl-prolyl cis-trans isomerase [Paenibacillus sp. EKM101P]KAF6617566.1 peptidyl-prolyl cis-trans isomerase [Paenibacillus sp. EKM102P]KAF6625884.1 peptidyl-prolyl cis-trans isomerase [Paenibacillus sp. EKM10P]KAF6642399.1 peptidyl-prolyl cis-trans isomerase [Paenibacillus sp. EKM11P]